VPCDVGDPAQVAELVAMVEQHFGWLDTLVNNAGVIQVGPAEHMTPEDYEAAFRAHLLGPLHVTDAVLPGMRDRGAGRVVNVCSIAGLVPVPHMLPYTASKFALAGWSDGLRAELAGSGISVTTVCPAPIRMGSPRHAEFKDATGRSTPGSASGLAALLSMDAGGGAGSSARRSAAGHASCCPRPPGFR
jgi:NAD(P)-dependent dehydrogenase (short-subunit alcohol dehydrogenase family)